MSVLIWKDAVSKGSCLPEYFGRAAFNRKVHVNKMNFVISEFSFDLSIQSSKQHTYNEYKKSDGSSPTVKTDSIIHGTC